MAKSKAKPATVYTATILATGPVQVDGTIVNEGDNFIELQHKKPRSSKYLVSMFDKSNILARYTDEEGNTSIVTTGQFEYDTVSGTAVNNGDGTVTITTEDGLEVTVQSASVQLTGDAESEAEEKPKAKPATKAKAKAKVEEEDDDEDEEEEEEEEPAPKSRAKSKASAKPKAKAKEDDDEDDWE